MNYVARGKAGKHNITVWVAHRYYNDRSSIWPATTMCSPPSRPRHSMLFSKTAEVRVSLEEKLENLYRFTAFGSRLWYVRVRRRLLFVAASPPRVNLIESNYSFTRVSSKQPWEHDTCRKLTSTAAPEDCVVVPLLLNPF